MDIHIKYMHCFCLVSHIFYFFILLVSFMTVATFECYASTYFWIVVFTAF